MAPHAQAMYFGPAGAECFGWLHMPNDDVRTGLGVVICSPFGHEDQSAYRGLRQLAMLAAQAGIASLRFDHASTGDSAGLDGEHDHPTEWLRSVHAAIDTLRAHAGVTHVCVLGARLGVLAAAQAASSRDDVCAFVALAPVVRGRGFLREAMLRTSRSADDGLADLDVAGHVVTARARAELGAIDLLALPPPAAHVLVVDADSLRASERWLARLTAQGAEIEAFTAPALADMLEGVDDVTVPGEMLSRIVLWIAARATRFQRGAMRAELPAVSALRLDGVHETPLTLCVGATDLFAILSEPESGPPRRAMLLLNTGSARRIGPSRMHVTLARRWARDGVAVLRLDLPGLGDSGVQPGETEGEAYAIDTVPAINAALGLLRARFVAIDCQLAGICSGAYHAYRAALAGVPVASLLLINQATYCWHAGMHLSRPTLALRLAWLLNERNRGGATSARDGTLLRTLSRFKWAAMEHGMAAFGMLRDTLRMLRLPLPNDVGEQLLTLANRGVAVHIVVSDDDRAGALLRIEAGRAAAALQRRGKLQLDTITDADHLFTSRQARQRVQVVLDRIVHGPLGTLHEPGLRASANATTAALPTAASTRSISR